MTHPVDPRRPPSPYLSVPPEVENVSTELTDPAFVSAGTDLDTDFRTRC